MSSYDPDFIYNEFLKDSSDDYPKYADGLPIRRGDRVADCAALEMPSCGNATVGSNPALSAAPFKEVIRLARAAVQPWWTQEYRDSTEGAINQVEKYFEKNILKTD